MEQEMAEHLIKCSEKVARTEAKYLSAKEDLEILKANYVLENDWEKLLGKSKPTQKEKDSYVLRETEAKKREVDDLKIQVDYCRRIFDIQMAKVKY